jgi:hypothetical protein
MVTPPRATLPIVSQRRARSNWIAAIFTMAAVLLAGSMIVLYLTRGNSAAAPVNQGSPETAVRGFLSAVFLADDPRRLAAVVCSSWPSADALARTKAMVDPKARVSWDDLRVVSDRTSRVTMTARLGLRLPDEVQPSVYQQWHFMVVNENGWRVCDASPAMG